MNKKLKRVVAIIALVFFAIGSVSLILWLANSKLFNGQIGFLTLFCLGIGFALFLTIKLSKDYSEDKQEKNTNNDDIDNNKKDNEEISSDDVSSLPMQKNNDEQKK